MQFKLLEILAANDSSGLMLFADQDQVIYQWNGASPTRLNDAVVAFNLRVLVLPTSYRCPTNVVKAAATLIAHNPSRFSKPDHNSERAASSSILVMEFGTASMEAEWIASQLAVLSRDEWPTTTVLARNKKLVEAAALSSSAVGVRASVAVARTEFISAPLILMHAILRLACQPDRKSSIRRLASSFYSMTGVKIDPEVLLATAQASNLNVLTAFFDIALSKSKSSEFRTLHQRATQGLIGRKDFRGLSEICFAWVDALGEIAPAVAYRVDYDEERQVWHDLESRHQGLRTDNVLLADFLRSIDLESKVAPALDAVHFSTVHQAKGLEFSRVFVLGLAEGQFPAFQAVKAGSVSAALEEERRSFFVAITRTTDDLVLTFARQYNGYNAQKSRFIDELGLESP